MSAVAVCGASGAIGAALCRAFTGAGWDVAAGARREDRLAELEDDGAAAVVHRLDVTDPDSVDAFFGAAEAALGGVDCVIANAGVAVPGPLAATSDADVRRVLDTNLYGSITVARRAIPPMCERKRGDVVFITSDSVEKPYPHMLTYGATKAAVEYLAAGLDVELAGTGIRSSIIRLGPTVSEFNTGWSDEDMIAFMNAWERLGIKEDFNYIPAEAVASAVVTAVTAPRGTKVSLLSVRPEATLDQDERTKWSTAASQGRA